MPKSCRGVPESCRGVPERYKGVPEPLSGLGEIPQIFRNYGTLRIFEVSQPRYYSCGFLNCSDKKKHFFAKPKKKPRNIYKGVQDPQEGFAENPLTTELTLVEFFNSAATELLLRIPL